MLGRLLPVLLLLLLAAPSPASAAMTSGGVLHHAVDARGCLLPPGAAGRIVAERRDRLAAAAVFASDAATNACVPRGDAWRSGWTMLSRTRIAEPTRRVEVEVRRLDRGTARDEWLLTRVGERELRVQHEVDQCNPRAWLRVVETDTEVRLRWFRKRSDVVLCTAVGFFEWRQERVVRLQRPLAGRRIVAELPRIARAWYDDHCPWYGAAIGAAIDGAPAADRAALVRSAPREGFGAQETVWIRALVRALDAEDAELASAVARGVRRDMRRLAYPDGCAREYRLPAAASSRATAFVLGGEFEDADLAGLDDAGAVTWATRVDGTVLALDACPDGEHALVATRTPGQWSRGEFVVRTSFVDTRTGTVDAVHGLRRLREDVYAQVHCSSGAGRTGWIVTSNPDPVAQPFVDELWLGASRRVQLPRGVQTNVLGDGFVMWQRSGLTPESEGSGRLMRHDLRTGTTIEGPELTGYATLMLAPDGRTLATVSGPIRFWDVANGISFRSSLPARHRGQFEARGAFEADGNLLLQIRPYSDPTGQTAAPEYHLYRVVPAAGTVTKLATHLDDQTWITLAHGGSAISHDPWGGVRGLQRFDVASATWTPFAPAPEDGWLEHADVVRPIP